MGHTEYQIGHDSCTKYSDYLQQTLILLNFFTHKKGVLFKLMDYV